VLHIYFDTFANLHVAIISTENNLCNKAIFLSYTIRVIICKAQEEEKLIALRNICEGKNLGVYVTKVPFETLRIGE